FVAPAAQPAAAIAASKSAAPAAAESRPAGWQLHIEFDSNILCNGSNPLDLLEDLCKLGSCFFVPVPDDVPLLADLEPEYCSLKWQVTLQGDCDRAAIDDVFMFVADEMKLTATPLAQADLPAPSAMQLLLDDAPPVVPELPEMPEP